LYNNYGKLTDKEIELFNCLKGLYTDILYSVSDRPIDIKNLFSELKKIEKLLVEIKNSSRKTAGASMTTRKNKQSVNGKTRKIIDRRNIFIRKPKIKRFKNPFYLSKKIKNKK
jgi:hypothetical protein